MRLLVVKTRSDNGQRTSSIDWWRTVNPSIALQSHSNWQIDIKDWAIPQDTKEADKEWFKLSHQYDLIWFSYMDNPIAFSYLQWLSQNTPLKYIIDVDDDLINVEDDWLLKVKKEADPRYFLNLKTILSECPYLTVSTPELKTVYRRLNHKRTIEVLPNYIDLSTYKAKPKIEHDTVRIGYYGTVSHIEDLIGTPAYPALVRILKERSNVVLSLIAVEPPMELKELPNVEYLNEGKRDFYEWVKLWQEWTRDIDVGIAPLVTNALNLGKSWIKPLEFGAAKIPCICSPLPSYKRLLRESYTGYLAYSEKDWYTHLTTLIDNATLRQNIGEMIYRDIVSNYTIQTNWLKTAQFLEHVYYENSLYQPRS